MPLKAGGDKAVYWPKRLMTTIRSAVWRQGSQHQNEGNHGGSWGACFREKGPAFKYSRVWMMVFFFTIRPSENRGLSNPGRTLLSLSLASSKIGQARMMWSRVWKVGGWL